MMAADTDGKISSRLLTRDCTNCRNAIDELEKKLDAQGDILTAALASCFCFDFVWPSSDVQYVIKVFHCADFTPLGHGASSFEWPFAAHIRFNRSRSVLKICLTFLWKKESTRFVAFPEGTYSYIASRSF
ncbi:hypothetical protein R1flu_003017 [Riccia fluitans]|uniref:Uncharacterized protein n=1 Tax=Riccia fluitans TaxID=41844 RepID=A0ABD1Y7S6_9MARC